MRSPGQPQPQPAYEPWAPRPSPMPRRQRLATTRAWLRSRSGRVVVPVITLVLGIGLGVMALFLYISFIATEGQVLVTPLPPPGGDIVVQIGPTYMARILQKTLRNSGLPGDIENVRIKLANSDRIHSPQVMVTGDDQTGVFGITRHLTLVVQLYVKNCQIQAHLLHADLGGIPATAFLTAFEKQIDQQLQVKFDGLPAGFAYCITSVRTKPEGLFVTFSATPKSA